MLCCQINAARYPPEWWGSLEAGATGAVELTGVLGGGVGGTAFTHLAGGRSGEADFWQGRGESVSGGPGGERAWDCVSSWSLVA